MQLKSLTSRLFIFFFSYAAIGIAQEVQISGTIRDLNTHREISHVNILIEGTRLGATSDYAGNFSLRITGSIRDGKVIFKHIAYETKEILLDLMVSMEDVFLQPRVIPLQGVEIEEFGPGGFEIERDLPQTVALIEAKKFEIRGYVDAGDLLRTDHSVQVDEALSGKKTVSIRGGNTDDVVVLYDGIKMNNNYNNIFDLSLIDLEDIERFEVIKGSNTSLYGPEAFSGVINIVPKIQQNYNLRFQQRLGTYRSGNWGLHLYNQFDRLKTAYSYKRGSFGRTFSDVESDHSRLINDASHQTGTLHYEFPEKTDGRAANLLKAMWIYTSLDYDNQRDNETLSNTNHLFSLKYKGDLFKIKDINLSASYRKLNEDQFFSDANQAYHRFIEDRSNHFNARKQSMILGLDLLFGYQFQDTNLDYLNNRIGASFQTQGLRSADFQRRHHGFVTIAKYNGETGSDFLRNISVEVSLRHDRVSDKQSNLIFYEQSNENQPGDSGEIYNLNRWHDTMFKFGILLDGYRRDLTFNTFLNFGRNTKFPTLFQQINSDDYVRGVSIQPNLSPEKSNSFELSAAVTKDVSGKTSIDGVEISANLFQVYYDNKFRKISSIILGLERFDNVQNARISGIESKSSVFLLKKKVTFEIGFSRYYISEKTAFPFKSDIKQTLSLSIDHVGYSFQIFWFREGEQEVIFRQENVLPVKVTLPDYMNMDIHLSKTFKMGNFKLFANASGRNLLKDDDVDLLGLTIRDRRFYVTIGAQY